MTKQTHVHKLRRHRYSSGNVTYFCALPDCKFKIMPALALGKRTICWRCGEEFILSEYAIRLAKPHCENCHKPKKELSYDAETSQAPEIIRAPIPLPVEPLSGQRIDSASDLQSRLNAAVRRPEQDEGDI